MAKRNLKPNDVVTMITFDIKIDNKDYKGVTLCYKPTKTWHLDVEDIFQEDNDSWYCVEIDNELCIDFQITGENDDMGMKNSLHIDGCYMYKENPEIDVWSHSDVWLSHHKVKYSNVKIHTQNGKCEIVRVVNN